MAQLTTKKPVKRAAGAVPRVPVVRPGATKQYDYTGFNLSFRNPEEFAKYLAGYPNVGGLMAYYYRLVPKIDLSLIGQAETSILKTPNVAEMNFDFAAQRWGKGKYMLKLNDANRAKGEQAVCKTWFDVSDPDLASIYDPRSLMVNDPVNADEVARLLQSGVMVRDALTGVARVKTEYAGGVAPLAAAPDDDSDVLSKNLLSTLILRLVDRGAQSPRDQLTQTIEVARLLAPPAPAVSPELAELRIKLAVLEATAARPVPSDAADSFETFTRIEGFLKAHGGGGGGGSSSGWAGELMAGLRDLLPMVLSAVPAIVEGVSKLQRSRTAGGSPVPVGRGGASNGPVAGSQAHRRAPGDPPAAGEYVAVGQAAIAPLDLASGDIFGRLVKLGNFALERMRAGMNGFDCASFVCASYTPGGLELFRTLAPDGTTGVMGLIGQLPEVIAAGDAGRAEIESFLDAFFEFDPDGGAAEAEAAVPRAA